MSDGLPQGEQVFRGIPVSGGICRGKVLVLNAPAEQPIADYQVTESDVAQQVRRLEEAFLRTRRQLEELQQKVAAKLGEKDALIFESHLMILDDPVLVQEVSRRVQDEKVNVERAWHEATEKFAAAFEGLPERYFQERAADVRDVAKRVLNNLVGRHEELDLSHLEEPCIIVSHDLKPSQTAMLDRKMALGFATEAGSKTSHTAIMANSLRIPAAVGLPELCRHLRSGDYALLDGHNGLLIVNPSDQTLFQYGEVQRRYRTLEEKLRDIRDLPAVTLDGAQIILSANVEHADDAQGVLECGANGVGLFRTEYIFLNRDHFPTEEEQHESYRQAASVLKSHPLIIRTLDLGGDKPMAHFKWPEEMNPFLGYRAIRFCLQEKDIFRAQLRAVLRASVEGNVKLMYPMISCLSELEEANGLLDECRAELRAKRIPFNEQMEIGVMIEIPAAALAAHVLAKRVKFFSIGTNDLIQYSLAVDRHNERIAHLYEPTNPAIVRLIKMTCDAAHAQGIWAGVCGEMAGDKFMTPLLLGLGVNELSAATWRVPEIKYLIRRLKLSECRELVDFALECDCGGEILARSQELVRRVAPSLFEVETQS